jgi:hypothetical protein
MLLIIYNEPNCGLNQLIEALEALSLTVQFVAAPSWALTLRVPTYELVSFAVGFNFMLHANPWGKPSSFKGFFISTLITLGLSFLHASRRVPPMPQDACIYVVKNHEWSRSDLYVAGYQQTVRVLVLEGIRYDYPDHYQPVVFRKDDSAVEIADAIMASI